MCVRIERGFIQMYHYRQQQNMFVAYLFPYMHTHRVEMCLSFRFIFIFNERKMEWNETTKWSHTFQLLFRSLGFHNNTHYCVFIEYIYLLGRFIAFFFRYSPPRYHIKICQRRIHSKHYKRMRAEIVCLLEVVDQSSYKNSMGAHKCFWE